MGTLLKELRLRAGLTVAGVAAEVGVTPAFLYQIESGHREPDKRVLARLCEVLVATTEEVARLAHLRAFGDAPSAA